MNTKNKPQKKIRQRPAPAGGIFLWVAIIFLFMYLANNIAITPIHKMTYGEFYNMLKTNKEDQKIQEATLSEDKLSGKISTGERFDIDIPANDPDIIKLMRENIPRFNVQHRTFW